MFFVPVLGAAPAGATPAAAGGSGGGRGSRWGRGSIALTIFPVIFQKWKIFTKTEGTTIFPRFYQREVVACFTKVPLAGKNRSTGRFLPFTSILLYLYIIF